MKGLKMVDIGLTSLRKVLVFNVLCLCMSCAQENDYQAFVNEHTNIFYGEKEKSDPCFSKEYVESNGIKFSYYLNDNSDTCLGFRNTGAIGDFTVFVEEDKPLTHRTFSEFEEHLQSFSGDRTHSMTLLLFTNITPSGLDKITAKIPVFAKLFFEHNSEHRGSNLNIVLVYRAEKMFDELKHIPEIPKDSAY